MRRGEGSDVNYDKPIVPTYAQSRRRDDVDVYRAHGNDGLIDNWEHFDALLNHTIENALNLGGSARGSHALLYAEPNHNGRAERERLVELLFEKCNLPAVYLARSAVLSAYANGRTTGVVLDVGHACTTAVPVVEGALARGKAVRTAIGGRAVGEALRTQLAQRDIRLRPLWSYRSRVRRSDDGETVLSRSFAEVATPRVTPSFYNFAVARQLDELKAGVCHVHESSGRAIAVPPAIYELPDGQTVELAADKFAAAESTLFGKLPHLDAILPADARPSYVTALMQATPGASGAANGAGAAASHGLHNLVMDAIHRCDGAVHRDMYAGVCLTGGTSDMAGLFERLSYGLVKRYHKVRVLAATGSHERKYCAWTGGSILGTFSEFQKMWFSRSEYEENGTAFVHRKCP